MALFEFSATEQSLKVSEIRELMKLSGRPGLISFAGGMPDADHFPSGEVAAVIRAWDGAKQKAAYQYGPTRGYPPLLDALHARMAARGISMAGQQVIVTTGAQGAIYLIARVLLNPGDRVVVESPTFIGALASFAACRARLEWVPLENDGMDMDALEKKLNALARKKALPRFIYTIPNFQNPAGISMSRPKRKRLLFLARKFNVPVLEDDPYGELYFSGQKEDTLPIKALKGARGHVLYVNTFSKILSPGMRLGWIIGPRDFIQRIERAKQSIDACSPSFSQVVARDYLSQGHADGYIGRMRKIYGEKCAAMVNALEAHMPDGVTFSRPGGGFFVWVGLPGRATGRALFKKVIKRNVAFATGTPFCEPGRGGGFIRLAFSNAQVSDIQKGVEIIGNALK